MKKLIVVAMVAMVLASCSEQHLLDDYVSQTSAQLSEQETSQTGIVNSYLEKARWGDVDAFLNLAKCYHDGIGVKSDFMGTLTMLMMADQYGVPNHSIEDYLMSLPDTDHTKMIFEAIAKLDRRATGIPITGSTVPAASTPPRCAAPPAAAMITLIPRPSAPFA